MLWVKQRAFPVLAFQLRECHLQSRLACVSAVISQNFLYCLLRVPALDCGFYKLLQRFRVCRFLVNAKLFCNLSQIAFDFYADELFNTFFWPARSEQRSFYLNW